MSKTYLTDKADFDDHVQDKNNPHETTAEQIGAQKTTQLLINVNCKTLHEPGDYIIQSEPPTVEHNVSLGLPNENGHWGISIYSTLIPNGINGKSYVCRNRDTGNLYIMHEVNNAYGEWVKIATTADLTNYLSLSGGDITGWINSISEGTRRGTFCSGNDAVILRAWSYNQNNARDIGIYNPDYSNLADSLRIWETGQSYRVFGEHNKALLANTIQHLIQTGDINMLNDATIATLNNIENAVQQNYAEAQQDGADALTLELLERGVL